MDQEVEEIQSQGLEEGSISIRLHILHLQRMSLGRLDQPAPYSILNKACSLMFETILDFVSTSTNSERF